MKERNIRKQKMNAEIKRKSRGKEKTEGRTCFLSEFESPVSVHPSPCQFGILLH